MLEVTTLGEHFPYIAIFIPLILGGVGLPFRKTFMGLRAQIFLVAGVTMMPAIKFLMTDATAAPLTIAFIGGMGYAGGNTVQILRKDLTRVEHIAIVVLMISIAAWIVFEYLKGHKKNLGR
jgi:membrane protein DedA with SNARE-associated domain